MLSSNLSLKTILALFLFTTLTLISCGKRKPPLPPIEKINQRVTIVGFQRGGKVLISWQMPARNAADGSILNIQRADIYRLAEKTDSASALSEEEYASRSTLIASLPISADDFGLKTISYTDQLEFASQNILLKYAVRLVNKSGQKAVFSNFLVIEPASTIAGNPINLTFKVAENSIILDWLKPEKNVDGTKPVNILGYNVYRSDSAKTTGTKINSDLLAINQFFDRKFQFGKEYFYFVRAVSNGQNGEKVESGESNIISLTPKDIFPPTPPSAITIAASPNVLSLFFALNPENDIAGYKIYRSENPADAKSNWILLTPDLLKTNTYQDKNVETGKKYYYYLQAVDLAGNISEPSEAVAETAL